METSSAGDSRRKPDWHRDELILALDVYLLHRTKLPDHASGEITALSLALRKLGVFLFPNYAQPDSFRNQNGVYMKLMNFRSHDPQYTSGGKSGLSRGSKADAAVWKEFATDHRRCRNTAATILAKIETGLLDEMLVEIDDQIEDAPEGRLYTRMHLSRERSRKLVDAKRKQVVRAGGELVCEACGFNFAKVYGPRGSGYMECHHTKPVSTLPQEGRTHIRDLALVCANCHRMIHRQSPWLSVKNLRECIAEMNEIELKRQARDEPK